MRQQTKDDILKHGLVYGWNFLSEPHVFAGSALSLCYREGLARYIPPGEVCPECLRILQEAEEEGLRGMIELERSVL